MPEKHDRFTEAQREQILALAPELDGHTIFKTSILQDFPVELQNRFTREHVSNTGDPKGTLFKDGRVLPKLTGVYGLQVLEGICNDLGLEYRRCMGRGFQAQECKAAIAKHFATLSEGGSEE